MSRNRKEDPRGLLIFYGLIILLVIFSLIATIFIWAAWIATEIFYAGYPKKPAVGSIGLSSEEEALIDESDQYISSIESRLSEIEQEGSHLRRRKDGLYHAGSALGAKLNDEIGQLLSGLADARAMVFELQALPDKRLREWCAPLERLIALRWGVSVYVITCIYALKFSPSSVVFMDTWIRHLFEDYLPSSTLLPVYGAISLSSLIATCAAVVSFIGYNRYVHRYFSRQIC